MRDADIIESFQLQAFERLGSIYPAEQAKDLSDQIAVELRRCSPPIVAEAAGRLWSEQNLSRLVSIVILLPFFPYSSDDGFAVIDYQRINPELGDCPQIAAITHHFDPMIDLVINHVSSHWGFWHSGQFASDYKKLFGELPSETVNKTGSII